MTDRRSTTQPLLVSDYLMEGAESALTAKALCAILDVSARDLTEQIERERRAGSPICASCGRTPGYFLAADRQELQEYCGSLRHRLDEVRKTLQACQQTLRNLPEEGANG